MHSATQVRNWSWIVGRQRALTSPFLRHRSPAPMRLSA